MPVNFGILQPPQNPGIQSQALPQESGGGGGDLLSSISGLLGKFGPNSVSQANNAVSASMAQTPPQSIASGLLNFSNNQQPVELSKATNPGVNMNLHPELMNQLPGFLKDMRAQGYDPVIASGFRTPQEQAQKVAEGASHTMHSQHETGNAVDIVDRRYGWDTKKYSKEISGYADAMARTAAKHGLTSGVQWKSFGPNGDFAHIQYTPQR